MHFDADDSPTLADILREARRKAGVTQKSLAVRTGIATPAISRIENGHESPSFERFRACVEALGYSPTVELRPLSGSRADPKHLAAEMQLTPSERLVNLFEWMQFGDQLARAVVSRASPREG